MTTGSHSAWTNRPAAASLPSTRNNRRHINQSIECFGNSLQLYIACIFQYSGIQDPARLALAVDDLEMALKNIDATAWLDLDNWWPVVIEHFRLSY